MRQVQEVQEVQEVQAHQKPKAEEHYKLRELEQLHQGAGCPVPRSTHVQTCTNGH